MKVFFLASILLITAHSYAQTETPHVPAKLNPDSDGVYTFVDGLPNFPGFDAALQKFIHKNMRYPENAIQKGIEGKVILRFIIDVDGSVMEVRVRRSLDPDLDAEAVRLIKLLPKFKPGTQLGKPVKVYFNTLVEFKLPNKK